MALLTLMKGLPLTYNRDMQEDKEGFFDTFDTLLATLTIFADMIEKMQIVPERMREAAQGSYVLATDIADYLVDKGMPFPGSARCRCAPVKLCRSAWCTVRGTVAG